MTDTVTAPARPKVDPEERTRRQPPYHVILLDDDHHTFEYVIAMLQQLFGYPPEKGYQLALEVHTTGRVIVLTTTREHAELKRDQIHAFGPDPTASRGSAGSMSAYIEPAC
jgi:ATP-dependent Clp protease adaptor protein ClpS